jgi:hypothetical protein
MAAPELETTLVTNKVQLPEDGPLGCDQLTIEGQGPG